MVQFVKDANEAIDALGGTRAVARALGMTDQAVCWWRERGIPPKHSHRFGKLLRKEKIKFTPALFGLEAPPQSRNGVNPTV